MRDRLVPFGIPKYVRKFKELSGRPPDAWPKQLWNGAMYAVRSSKEPVVSVVLIALNEQKGILPTLVSLALNHCSVPYEIILVDNGSTDKTGEWAEKLGVRVVREEKKGYAYARQAGLDAARGEVVLTGDADTIYAQDWVEELSKPLRKDPNVMCTYGIHVLVPETGRSGLGLQFYQVAKWFSQRLKGIQRPHLNCGGASMGYRREDAIKVGGYLSDSERGEDGKLAWLLGKEGKIKRVGKHDARIYTSMRRTDKDGSLWKAFWIRFLGTMKYFTHYFKKQKEH